MREFAWSIRTSSCGPAREETPPNGVGWHLKTGQSRASPGRVRLRRRIDGNRLGIARADFALFSTRIGSVVGGKCDSGAKQCPYASARFGAAKIGTDMRTFFSPCSRGDPFVKVLDCGLCRQLALLSGQKSILLPKIDKNRPRNSPTLPDTAGRPRIVENR